jgi:hypothetical protein
MAQQTRAGERAGDQQQDAADHDDAGSHVHGTGADGRWLSLSGIWCSPDGSRTGDVLSLEI